MQEYYSYQLSKPVEKEELRINISKRHGHIKAAVNIYSFVDKDTKQHVLYTPALEMSGYGETQEKAKEMIEFVIKDWMKYVKDLPVEKIQKELLDLGWKKSGYFNKQYSRAYVDDEGKLKNLNAENDKVERLSLIAA